MWGLPLLTLWIVLNRVALPAPHRPVFWMNDIAEAAKSSLLQHSRRRVVLRQCVRLEPPYSDGAGCALDETRRHGTGHALPLEAWKREVGDLDDAFTIRRCDETARARRRPKGAQPWTRTPRVARHARGGSRRVPMRQSGQNFGKILRFVISNRGSPIAPSEG